MPRVHVIVRGQVQGVGYRWFAARQAQRLALAGWVRNRNDGSVEAEVDGPRAALEEFLADLRRGPSRAAVTGLDLVWSEPAHGHREFVIRD